MTIICETSCSNEFQAAAEYARINFTPELVATIKQRWSLFAKLREADPAVQEISFYDLSAEYFDTNLEPEHLYEAFEEGIKGDWDTLPVADIPEDWFQRTESDRMVINAYNVHWEALPKHFNHIVETPGIEISELDAMLAEAEVAA